MRPDEFTSSTWEDLLREALTAGGSGDHQRAQSLLQQVTEHDPTPSGALSVLGASAAELSLILIQQALADLEAGNFDDAEHLFLAATEVDPDNSEACAMLQELIDGKMFMTTGDVKSPSSGLGAQTKLVLVVDDSDSMRSLIANALQKEGYEVVTAIDGDDALAKMSEQSVDMVVVDVIMPNMDGYQLCRAIRSAHKELPIVMLSAKDGFFDKARGRLAGSNAFMTKPFQRDDLVAAIQQFCPIEKL